MSIKLKITVTPETAIRNGRANAGTSEVELDDNFVASLDEEEREALIVFLQNPHLVKGHDATLEEVRRLLLAEAQRKEKARAEAEAWQIENARRDAERARTHTQKMIDQPLEAWLIGGATGVAGYNYVPEDLQQAFNARREAAEALLRQKEIDKASLEALDASVREIHRERIDVWVKANGNHYMRVRHTEGLLPESELLDAVRDQLFAPFNQTPRYERLVRMNVSHKLEYCAGRSDPNSIYFSSEELDDLTEGEYVNLEGIRGIARLISGAKVEAREHRAGCKEEGCDRMTLRRSAKVTIEWNGYTLTREYALTSPGKDTHWEP